MKNYLKLAAISVCLSTPMVASGDEINIYSYRQPFLIQPLLDEFSKDHGTKVNVVYASKGLAQRLQAEGARSPADLVLTVDISRLSVYADKDLLVTNGFPKDATDMDYSNYKSQVFGF